MGVFITFEGIEGSGKTTQIKLLEADFRKKGKSVLSTREPGGTAIGDQIRGILLTAQNKSMVRECELLLYSAARVQHLREVIQPALAAGKIVLCDRFIDATRAYQGGGRGFSDEVLEKLIEFSALGVKPDLTILLDCDPEMGLTRSRNRLAQTNQLEKEGRFEAEELSFHQKVRKAYLEIAKAEPNRVVVISADKEPNKIFDKIIQEVEAKISVTPTSD